MDKKLFLQTQNITKRFGEVVAVDHVDMNVYLGEIRGLIGENGSGKSTISSMISGIHTVTSGKMSIEGKPYKPSSPADAQKNQISMIVQEIGTIDHLTVAENIFLGNEKQFSHFGVMDRPKMNAEAQKALDDIGIEGIEADKSIDIYNFEQRKLIEIAKALYYKPTLFIVDETTTALSQDGRIKIYEIMKTLREQGKAVLFISHDLPELMEVCDSLTVLRDGKLIATLEKEQFDENIIKQTMVGREIKGNYYREDFDSSHGKTVMLKLNNVTTNILKNINLELHEGEILGIGGLSGSGIHDIGKACYGMENIIEGNVIAKGTRKLNTSEKFKYNMCKLSHKQFNAPEELEDYNIYSIEDALKASIGYISKNRDRETLILESDIADNLTLSALDKLQVFGVLSPFTLKKFAEKTISDLRIKCSSRHQLVKELSGGNKQKISFGKWIGNNSKILVFDSPTRGVDVGVKTTMYQLLYNLKKQGYAILIISEELPELIGMSDRICILKDGEITKEFARSPELTDAAIIEYMI